MTSFEGVETIASKHAVEQATRRCAHLANAGSHGITFWIERQAAKALLDGRSAKTQPRWCTRTLSRHKVAGQNVRYLWNEQQTVVFIVRRLKHTERDPRAWLVLTVMVPGV